MPFITIATEDELSESVADRLVCDFLPLFNVNQRLRKGGNGYLKSKCHNFNQMALRQHVLLITDLDNAICPVTLIANWFGHTQLNPNLIFRVAVKEIESWLLADHEGMQNLLVNGGNALTNTPDHLNYPKEYLLHRAKKAPREIKNDIVRVKGQVTRQGLGYNARLCQFVRETWSPARAQQTSESLSRAIQRLQAIGQDI